MTNKFQTYIPENINDAFTTFNELLSLYEDVRMENIRDTDSLIISYRFRKSEPITK